MASMAAESVGSIVTDPPYHLTGFVKRIGAADAAVVKAPPGATGAYARTLKSAIKSGSSMEQACLSRMT